MLNTLELTDDELTLLHLLLTQDLSSSRVELHHTAGLPYRASIKRRLAQGKALLQKMNQAYPKLVSTDAPPPPLAAAGESSS